MLNPRLNRLCLWQRGDMSFRLRMGFTFELRFLIPNGLQKKGLTTGVLSEERLYLIIYLGTAEHYYEKRGTAVERLIDSIDTL